MVGLVITAIMGEWLCLQREMRDIEIGTPFVFCICTSDLTGSCVAFVRPSSLSVKCHSHEDVLHYAHQVQALSIGARLANHPLPSYWQQHLLTVKPILCGIVIATSALNLNVRFRCVLGLRFRFHVDWH